MNRIFFRTATEAATRQLVANLFQSFRLSGKAAVVLSNGMKAGTPWLDVFPKKYKAAYSPKDALLTFQVEALTFRIKRHVPKKKGAEFQVCVEVEVPYVDVRKRGAVRQYSVRLRRRVLCALYHSLDGKSAREAEAAVAELLHFFTQTNGTMPAGRHHD